MEGVGFGGGEGRERLRGFVDFIRNFRLLVDC